MSAWRGVAGVGAGAVTAALLFGLVYGARDGLLMGVFLLAIGGLVLGAVHLLARRRHRSGSLARHFSAGGAASIGLITLGVGAVALLMFISPHDALTMAVLLLFAGALTGYSLWVLSRGPMDDIQEVAAGLHAVGEGRRDLTIQTGGQDELGDLAASANRMVGQLADREAERDAADDARRDLVAAVSHDLRTPLTSLLLLADAVRDNVGERETRDHYLEQMSLHLRSLSALIDDLFELSRLEAGEIQWSMRQVHLRELVEETVEAMRPHADAGRVAVQVAVSRDLAPARANPEKVQRVLFNLIQNAIRHTPTDGSVTVRAELNGGELEVEVSDTGAGLAPGERGHAFEPFYRGDENNARSGDGAGLGLAICRAIVEAHGGKIWFADSKQGARVRFSLPRAV